MDMTYDDLPENGGRTTPSAKPKIAILGEFSSGKSTLTNVLLGRLHSPVQVTATQMPPILYCYGEDDPVIVGMDGTETEIVPENIKSVPVEGTRYVRVFLRAEILRRADIFDMPGSSDPNMSADVWHAVLPEADRVIWCTPATQAWRQSEAAIWAEVDPDVQERSVLLVTRIDKVLTDSDRARLMKRLHREVRGQFRDIFAVDLIAATADLDKGATGVHSQSVRAVLAAVLSDGTEEAAAPAVADAPRAATVLRLQDRALQEGDGAGQRSATPVLPRRVTAGALGGLRRPRRTSERGGSAI